METILKFLCCIPFNQEYGENQDNKKNVSVDYSYMNSIPMPLFMKKYVNDDGPNEEHVIITNDKSVKVIDEFFKTE